MHPVDTRHSGHADPLVSRRYAWTVFALVIGLMLSDYLSRQVMNAIFPFLKADWQLTDTQLGSLVSVVALVVGVFTFPIALISDRVGRVRSATAMAIVWGLATIACGLAGNFTAMVIARALVGLGEAGYGSAGGAILTSVFPRRLHSTVMGAFLAASLFGSVLGVMLGGIIAKHLGWPMAFILIGAAGLVLAVVFPVVVKEPPTHRAPDEAPMPLRQVMVELFRFRTIRCVYLGSGFQMFIMGAVIAWAPSYLNRYYDLDPAQAAVRAGVLILISGIGMTLGGVLADRLNADKPENHLRLSGYYGLSCGALLLVAFSLPPGPIQLTLIALGLLSGSGFTGPSGAAIADITHTDIRATAFATTILANNLIGLAPGPFITGLIADAAGLDVAMRIVPVTCLIAGCFYLYGARSYAADRAHYNPPKGTEAQAAIAA